MSALDAGSRLISAFPGTLHELRQKPEVSLFSSQEIRNTCSHAQITDYPALHTKVYKDLHV